jgi:hypothetical protein
MRVQLDVTETLKKLKCNYNSFIKIINVYLKEPN